MTFRVYTTTPDAEKQAKALGIYGQVASRLARMARRSAPLTSEFGNRRFYDFALTIEGSQVVWIAKLTDHAA